MLLLGWVDFLFQTVPKAPFYRAFPPEADHPLAEARVPVALATNISEAKASKPDLKVGKSSF